MNAAQQAKQNNQSNQGGGNQKADELMKMLQSEAMKNARQMAQRAKQNQSQPSGQPQNQPPTGSATTSTDGNATGGPGSLDELDPRTRATILQLPPRVREELLQGMKSQGPEGYQKFIQDYFRRLADVQKQP
jgi:hypothetical protein